MAENTQKLIDAMKTAVSGLESAVSSVEDSAKSFQSATKRLQDSAKNPAVEGWSKMHESAITEQTFYGGAVTVLAKRITDAEKAAKTLKSKVNVKKFLDIFKDQKSLDDAKKSLKAGEDAIVTAKSDLAKGTANGQTMGKMLDNAKLAVDLAVKSREANASILATAAANVAKGLASCKTTAEYEAKVRQPVRAVAAAVAKNAGLSQYTPVWAKISGDDYMKGVTDETLPAKLAKIKTALDALGV